MTFIQFSDESAETSVDILTDNEIWNESSVVNRHSIDRLLEKSQQFIFSMILVIGFLYVLSCMCFSVIIVSAPDQVLSKTETSNDCSCYLDNPFLFNKTQNQCCVEMGMCRPSVMSSTRYVSESLKIIFPFWHLMSCIVWFILALWISFSCFKQGSGRICMAIVSSVFLVCLMVFGILATYIMKDNKTCYF